MEDKLIYPEGKLLHKAMLIELQLNLSRLIAILAFMDFIGVSLSMQKLLSATLHDNQSSTTCFALFQAHLGVIKTFDC